MDAAAWDERYAATELVWSAGPNRFVAAECAALSPGTALDLAAGEGRNAIWLAEHGWQCTAVDFSQVALDKGATLAGDLRIDWVCADIASWEHPHTWDLVVVAYFQVPAEVRRPTLRRAYAALNPGGHLVLVAHDSSNLTEGYGGPQEPSVLYTADDVVADLAPSGVVRAERVERVVADPHSHRAGPQVDGSAVALDCLVHVTAGR